MDILDYKGQWIKTINVLNQPKNRIGIIDHSDEIGKLYIIWDDGTDGIIREKDDRYQFTTKRTLLLIKIKFLRLIRKNKYLKTFIFVLSLHVIFNILDFIINLIQ